MPASWCHRKVPSGPSPRNQVRPADKGEGRKMVISQQLASDIFVRQGILSGDGESSMRTASSSMS
ncbi:hypothetical protein BN77_2469 [Rhizobium mesoamericanum STM3625]|uniref:Uncharacterized protein n=1 Tax=Rhizobium mesoamericanum STM3625 TaxID=1211777 RepID=K0PZ79_9HYPH|nr:hypothetical protein BN77_2469 [Rhizobium mesoamericanum STM3625]